MPTPPQLTIVGLGLIGASFGLALKRAQATFRIVGHDKDAAAARKAKSLNAVDSTEWNLISACENADVIFLAVPTAAIQPMLEILRTELRAGCVVIDAAPVKAPILEMASAILPDTVHFIGSDPVLAGSHTPGAGQPSADLFDKATWALCPTAATPSAAIDAAANLVTAIGATPYFLEAEEHDGLLAAVSGLPTALAAALMNMAAGSPAWAEARRLAGTELEHSTYLPAFSAEDFAKATWDNRHNLTRWIETLIAELHGWQHDLGGENATAIEKRFASANKARAEWMQLRQRGDWDQRAPAEEIPSVWEQMVGLGRRRRPRT